jgi:hypothetical protein
MASICFVSVENACFAAIKGLYSPQNEYLFSQNLVKTFVSLYKILVFAVIK